MRTQFLFAPILILAALTFPIQAEVEVNVRNPNSATNAPVVEITPMELVLTRDGKECDARGFLTAFGNATVQLVTDTRKVQYAVLRYAEGKDKMTRSEFIAIYRIGERLTLVTVVPVSGQAGVDSRWKYECKIMKPKTGGLLFSLTLQLEGNDNSRAPEESAVTIIIS